MSSGQLLYYMGQLSYPRHPYRRRSGRSELAQRKDVWVEAPCGHGIPINLSRCYVDLNASSGSNRQRDDRLPRLTGGCPTLAAPYAYLTTKVMRYHESNLEHDHLQDSSALWSDSDALHNEKQRPRSTWTAVPERNRVSIANSEGCPCLIVISLRHFTPVKNVQSTFPSCK